MGLVVEVQSQNGMTYKDLDKNKRVVFNTCAAFAPTVSEHIRDSETARAVQLRQPDIPFAISTPAEVHMRDPPVRLDRSGFPLPHWVSLHVAMTNSIANSPHTGLPM